MSNVDLIIKYLSKEMNRKESGSFEKMLSSDADFKSEYDEVSAAFNLIRDELRKKDEAEFRSRLREAMEKSREKIQNRSPRRSGWYLLLPLAGSLAILIALSLIDRGSDRLITKFFNPGKDPVLLAFDQETRGEMNSGSSLYHRGFTQQSREKAKNELEADPGNRAALLYFLVSSIELDLENEALSIIMPLERVTHSQLDQSILWYKSLALVKAGMTDEAVSELRVLEQLSGPYESDARRLKKMLLK